MNKQINKAYAAQMQITQKKLFYRAVCFLPAVLLVFTVFLVIFSAVLSIIFLISIGILAIPVSAGMLTGLLQNVATDLAPPAMALAGVSCMFASSALVCMVLIVFPKLVKKADRLIDWFRAYDTGSEN